MTVATFRMQRAPSGEWLRTTSCPHGTRATSQYSTVRPDLQASAAEAFAQHQQAFGCSCSLKMGTTELPSEPEQEIVLMPLGFHALAPVESPAVTGPR